MLYFPDNVTYGEVVAQAITTPAAGASATIVVQPNELWRPMGIRGTFTASAAAANRQPFVSVTDPTVGGGYFAMADRVVVASALIVASWIRGGAQNSPAANQFVTFALFDALISAGQTITVGAINIQAADTWTALSIWYERWLVSPT